MLTRILFGDVRNMIRFSDDYLTMIVVFTYLMCGLTAIFVYNRYPLILSCVGVCLSVCSSMYSIYIIRKITQIKKHDATKLV